MAVTILNQRYQLDEELGRGSMGVVYRAHDLLLERDVLVKVLSQAHLDADGRDRLLREARATAKLDHPNIISVYDAGEADAGTDHPGVLYIVMQFFAGKSLHEVGSLAILQVLEIIIQVCNALEHAHRQGIIHRDVKPENVIVVQTGDHWTARLTDFGLARSMASRLTTEGMIVGTVFYMPPEQALGQPLDGRADLYALGVMLYELVAGRLPFEADNPLAVISQHLHAPPVPPSTFNEQIHPALEALILRLLSKQPDDRPASADEVCLALEEILNQPAQPAIEQGAPVETQYFASLLDRITRGRLVGRQREMAEVTAKWKQAARGESQVLLVSGEPGVGKSRLVRELTTLVKIAQGQALAGECFAEGGLPYAPFAQCLQDMDLTGFDQTSGLADLIMLVPALGARYPDVPPNPPVELMTEQHRLFGSVFNLLSTLCTRSPLLLILEDVHWADRGTLSLFQYLAHRAARQKMRLLLVLTYREIELDEDHALNDVLMELNRERLGTRLKLSRLDYDQTCDLLGVLFADEITPELLDGIYRETEGNPFFVEEVCKALIEEGSLTHHGGRWHRPPMEEITIPQSIRLAVQTRLRKLPQPAQDVLKVAAVFGRVFEYDTLREVSELGDDALLDALEAAERAQLITQVDRRGQKQTASQTAFTFTHALIPSTLEEGLSRLRRQRLHQRAVSVLEKLNPNRLDELAARLGRHCLEAGDWDKATDYLLRAGDRARQQFASEEAVRYYLQALTLLQEQGLGSLDRAASAAMKLALLYHSLGENDRSRQTFQQAFSLWQQAGAQPAPSLPPAPHPLRLYWWDVVPKLDPLFTPSMWGICILDHLFSRLVEWTPPPQVELVPGIAHSWEVVDEGQRYIFYLRRDFTWSDGVPVTAGDFVYSILRSLDRKLYPQFTAPWYEIKGARAYHRGEVTDPESVAVHALDDYTLSIELEEPLGHFIYNMRFIPLPRHVVETYGQEWTAPEHLVTNGAFCLAAWEPNKRILLERNPAFRGRFSGNLQQVELILVDEKELYNPSAYEQGRVDVIRLNNREDLQSIRSQYPQDFVERNILGEEAYFFKRICLPFNDRRVRQAFVHAVDRQALANLICHGNVIPITGGLYSPGFPGHTPGIALDYDPERARRLLAEAGYPGGKGFPEILVWTDSRYLAISKHIQTQWRDNLGVLTSWSVVDLNTRLSLDWEHAQTFPDILFWGLFGDLPDAILYIFGETNPDSRWYDAYLDKLVKTAVRNLDPAERLRYMQAVDRYITEEAWYLQFYYPRNQLLVKPWVKACPFSAVGAGNWKPVILEPHEG